MISLRNVFLLVLALASTDGFQTVQIISPANNRYARRNENGLVPLVWNFDGEINAVVVSVDGNVERLLLKAASKSSCEIDVEDGWHQFEVAGFHPDGTVGVKTFVEFYVTDDDNPDGEADPPSPIKITEPLEREYKYHGDDAYRQFELRFDLDPVLASSWQGARTIEVFLNDTHHSTFNVNQYVVPFAGLNPGDYDVNVKLLSTIRRSGFDERRLGQKSSQKVRVSEKLEIVNQVEISEAHAARGMKYLSEAKEAVGRDEDRAVVRALLFSSLFHNPNLREAREMLESSGHASECPSMPTGDKLQPLLVLGTYGFRFEYRKLSYATHQPVLHKLGISTQGDILELGVGPNSSPMLHTFSKYLNKSVVSVDSDPEWIKTFLFMESPTHKLIAAENLDDPSLKEVMERQERWGVTLVDLNNWDDRLRSARFFATRSDYVVVHDADYFLLHDHLRYAEFRFFKEIFPPRPWPSHNGPPVLVISEFHDLSDFSVDTNCYEKSFIQGPIDDTDNSFYHTKPLLADETTYVDPSLFSDKTWIQKDPGPKK